MMYKPGPAILKVPERNKFPSFHLSYQSFLKYPIYNICYIFINHNLLPRRNHFPYIHILGGKFEPFQIPKILLW